MDAASKWRPGESNIQQVLLSIQGLIFVEAPFFNEPMRAGVEGSAQGQRLSDKYNERIRFHTLQHAVLGQLRRYREEPFGEVIRRYARLQANSLREQVIDI